MNKLILTFSLSIVSVISFSQIAYINYTGGDSTGVLSILDQDFTDTTIYVNGNVQFTLPGSITISEKYSDFATNVIPSTFQWSDSTLPMSVGQTKYLLLMNGLVGSKMRLTLLYIDPFTSLSENSSFHEELKVYPSPGNSIIKISFEADKSDMPVNIFSSNGQLVHQDNKPREVGSITILELNVSSWEKGIYYVNYGNQTIKFAIL